VHDARKHCKINIYGSVTRHCTFRLDFSPDGSLWYPTNRYVEVPSTGVVDGAFDNIAVPYVRLRMTAGDRTYGTILITGKGL